MIVIPTYNERKNIRPLWERIRLRAPEEEIFFVDDNSPDGTADEIRFVIQDDPRVRLLVRPGKIGLGSAYREAFAEIINHNLAEHVITMDADLSHPPDAISAIVEKLTEYPVVIGSRYTRGGRVERWGALRRILSRLANYYAQILTGLPASDLTSGFVGYRTEALKSVDLHSIKLDGYAFQIEIKYALYRARQFLYEIPITFIERREGQSKMSWKIIFEGALFPIKILFSRIW